MPISGDIQWIRAVAAAKRLKWIRVSLQPRILKASTSGGWVVQTGNDKIKESDSVADGRFFMAVRNNGMATYFNMVEHAILWLKQLR